MRFSIMFFSSYTDDESERYRYLLDATRLVDGSRIGAVWLPERHFARFGGLFPNPAVVGAAVAVSTQHLRIRAGSVIMPLHDPLRVAEEWSVVDNLSGGRVEVSFGSGWNVNDFVLAPERYQNRREHTHEQIDRVRQLWRGESLARLNGAGVTYHAQTLPRPIQAELPVWLTAQSDQTFALAADAGYPVLTNLNFTTPEVIARRCEVYRKHLNTSSPPSRAAVAVMVHTHLAASIEEATSTAVPALRGYLESNLDLRSEFAAGKPGGEAAVSEQQRRDIVDNGVQRIIDRASLIGSVESLMERVEWFRAQGVDELACLVDFGVCDKDGLRGLELLCELAERSSS